MIASPNDRANPLTIGPSTAKLFASAAFAAAAFGGPALILLFAPHRTSDTRIPSDVVSAVLLIVGCCIVALLAKRASCGTIVTLSRAGVRDRRLSDDVVPWTAITDVRMHAVHASGYVEIVADPAFNRTFKGTVRYRLKRALGRPALRSRPSVSPSRSMSSSPPSMPIAGMRS